MAQQLGDAKVILSACVAYLALVSTQDSETLYKLIWGGVWVLFTSGDDTPILIRRGDINPGSTCVHTYIHIYIYIYTYIYIYIRYPYKHIRV